MVLRIGSRRSDLARLQSYQVAAQLKKKFPYIQIEFLFKESLGDKNLQDPLWKMPEKGVFTEDFVADLASGQVDMVVHSWKDLPTELRKGSEIVATLPRADQRDMLLFKREHFSRVSHSKKLQVFSSSPRREFNLQPFFKDHLPFALDEVNFVPVRGNIQTRVRKLLESSEADALVLAKAAWDRLVTSEESDLEETRSFLKTALQKFFWSVLPLSQNPTAAAQGALAIEVLNSRKDLKDLLKELNCLASFTNVLEERKILSAHGGGCHQKIGISVSSHPHGNIKSLRGQTLAGEGLFAWTLSKSQNPPRFLPHQIWSQKKFLQKAR